MRVVACIFLLLSITYVYGQNLPTDPMEDRNVANTECLRCLCNARTGCFFLKNCASYSITKDYWIRGKRQTVGNEDPNSSTAFSNCMVNDECIRSTIREYVMTFAQRDCNCDGKVDCKDFLALHLKGDQCRGAFHYGYLNRFDTCVRNSNMQVAPGWNMQCSNSIYG